MLCNFDIFRQLRHSKMNTRKRTLTPNQQLQSMLGMLEVKVILFSEIRETVKILFKLGIFIKV